jgi:hypothetical protein
MSIVNRLQKWRDWFPIPQSDGRVAPIRWVLLEGNRNAVTAALLSFVFTALILIGSLWTFEMADLVTETSAVQTILDTFLSGIILLVSIVVSINSIVLSHDITSVKTQENRLEATMNFREDIGRLTDSAKNPTDPASFLTLMSKVLAERVDALEDCVEGTDEEYAEELQEYATRVAETAQRIDAAFTDNVSGAEFGVLWLGLEIDYGEYMNRSHSLQTGFESTLSEDTTERLEDLNRAFQLFTTGKEYFKTLYYSQEVSELSRTLLVISLPTIIVNASAILAINARLLPDFWLFGLPPILTFVAAVFTISLTPYVILTAYMLRLATVAKRTTAAGPFSVTT